jgi:hypothetical protein
MWSFETAQLRVEWSIAPEDDIDISWDETDETRDNLNSGLWVCFMSRMRVTHKDTGAELGCDYLGNSIYENPSEFRDHIGARGKYGSYFRDMVSSACKAARVTLRSLGSIRVREVNHV